jgi:hypothetical protein
MAAEIEGLAWHENAPSFEAVAIDERGEPLRIVATDPRVWAALKLWLSNRKDREPLKRRHDEAQARIVARLVVQYMPHLPFASEELRMLPKDVVDDAALCSANRDEAVNLIRARFPGAPISGERGSCPGCVR